MSKGKTDYLRMPIGKNNRYINFGNRILSASNPLLRPVVKAIRKTAKYLNYKSRNKSKSNKTRKSRK